MSEASREVPAFACCSVGIGRWFWVAWESEVEARALSPAMASGYEASANRAEAAATARLGAGLKRLPAKWASSYKRGGIAASRPSGSGREAGSASETRPRSRFGRPTGTQKRNDEPSRLAFLYSAVERETPDSLGHVTVTRHRIVKQNARKIHVERDPFDEDEWARRADGSVEFPEEPLRPRTVAVDRLLLRTEGRFECGGSHRGLTFFATEEDGIRVVEAALTAKHTWCARLGVRFPCSVDSIKAAYRRVALTTHPDVGGDPAAFRTVEQAYREALAYFTQGGEAMARG